MEDRRLFKCFLILPRHATGPKDCRTWYTHTGLLFIDVVFSLHVSRNVGLGQSSLPRYLTVLYVLYFLTSHTLLCNRNNTKIRMTVTAQRHSASLIPNCYALLLIYLSHHLCRFTTCQTRRLCGLRRRSAAIWLLGPRVLIPLRAWMFVSCFCCVSCRLLPLRRADHSFRGVLLGACVYPCMN